MTLHLAKMVLDLSPARAGRLAVVVLLALTGWNLHQTVEAAAPSRAYRAKLMAAVRDVRERRPPMLVAEFWISYFLANVYLRDLAGFQVMPPIQTYAAHDHEAWLQRRQSELVPGTLLLTRLRELRALHEHPPQPSQQRCPAAAHTGIENREGNEEQPAKHRE